MNERLIAELKHTKALIEERAHGFIGNYDHEEEWYLTTCGITQFETFEERDELIKTIQEWISKHPTDYDLARFAHNVVETLLGVEKAPCIIGMIHIQINKLLQILESV